MDFFLGVRVRWPLRNASFYSRLRLQWTLSSSTTGTTNLASRLAIYPSNQQLGTVKNEFSVFASREGSKDVFRWGRLLQGMVLFGGPGASISWNHARTKTGWFCSLLFGREFVSVVHLTSRGGRRVPRLASPPRTARGDVRASSRRRRLSSCLVLTISDWISWRVRPGVFTPEPMCFRHRWTFASAAVRSRSFGWSSTRCYAWTSKKPVSGN